MSSGSATACTPTLSRRIGRAAPLAPGRITPGFRMPSGSKARLTRANSAMTSSP